MARALRHSTRAPASRNHMAWACMGHIFEALAKMKVAPAREEKGASGSAPRAPAEAAEAKEEEEIERLAGVLKVNPQKVREALPDDRSVREIVEAMEAEGRGPAE